ncbi:MAG TPA: uroporphyrinogen-III C-methyltransferase [Gaiellaceae bacterium]|nr:uroporphyrinogen-III C-methyltransferase [Gaiellaceae bacterium]
MTVSLVGAGPGDPGLITVRGLARVRAAELLVYDRLVAPELVAEARCERIARDDLTQDEVNAILVAAGRERHVVRLKGGDPLLFGRGGEEALALARDGVPFEIVPGVSALTAAPAAASIPITHRGAASAVTAFAAHDPDGLDVDALAALPGTLVGFMGLAGLPRLAELLVEAGKDADTPAAVVACAGTPRQQVVTAPLAELPQAAAGLPAPALVVIGEVVAVGDRIAAREPLAAAARI